MEYELTKADLIWNRACTPLMSGDKALAALLQVHGLVMNGGVFHALEFFYPPLAYFSPQELDAAIAGYRLFGFDDVGDLLIEAKSFVDTGDEERMGRLDGEFDRRYNDLLPGDARLVERFKTYLLKNPGHFARLDRGE